MEESGGSERRAPSNLHARFSRIGARLSHAHQRWGVLQSAGKGVGGVRNGTQGAHWRPVGVGLERNFLRKQQEGRDEEYQTVKE